MSPSPLSSGFAVLLSILSAWVARDTQKVSVDSKPCECHCNSVCEFPVQAWSLALVFFAGVIATLVVESVASRLRWRRPASPPISLEPESLEVVGASQPVGKGRAPIRRGGGLVVRA